jgi:predicted transcriptional regulator
MYKQKMDFRQLCEELGEDRQRVRYWAQLLVKEGLIKPPKRGIRQIFSQPEVETFRQIKQYLAEGADSTVEAIRLMKNNINPSDAIKRYEQAQRHIELLQKKVLQLRKPFWKRLVDWVKGLLSGVLFTRTEQW